MVLFVHRLQILTDKDRWGAGTGLIADARPSNQRKDDTQVGEDS